MTNLSDSKKYEQLLFGFAPAGTRAVIDGEIVTITQPMYGGKYAFRPDNEGLEYVADFNRFELLNEEVLNGTNGSE